MITKARLMSQLSARAMGVAALCWAVGMVVPHLAAAETMPLLADAYTKSAAAGRNFGSGKTLQLQGPPATTATARVFLKFDLSTLAAPNLETDGSHVTKATLVLGVHHVTRAGSFSVFRVTGPAWTEAALTDASAPALAGTPEGGGSLAVTDKNTFMSIDVTQLVRDWLNGVLPDHGVALVPSGAGVSAMFDSKESTSTSHFARLEVTLTGEGDGDNTALGEIAYWASTGVENTAVGSGALVGNAGDDNTAVGFAALTFSHTGNNNTAVGSGALAFNSSGHDNIALGFSALNSNGSGNHNTALGTHTIEFNGTGFNNTAVGASALHNNVSGSNNVAIGASAGSALTTGSNNIDIGNSGFAADPNTIRVGDPAVHTATFIAGIRGITTGMADGVTVLIDSNGQLGTISSSRRFKQDIQDMGGASSKLMQLRPVTFRYKSELDPSGTVQYGLIAEEVAQVLPELVARDKNGNIETVKYQLLDPMLLNEVQKQAQQIEALTARLAQLEAAGSATRGVPALQASYRPEHAE